MAERRVTWTKRALEEREKILNYWRFRNKSNKYPIHLFNLFNYGISLLIYHPEIGISLIKAKDVRYILVKSYRIYYTFSDSHIYILSIWDLRRNPKKFK